MKVQIGTKGSSLPEVVATVGVIAILMAIAALGVNRRFADLESAHQELINAVREVRMRATVKGSHYRLTPLSTSYEIQRLKDTDGDGIWDIDTGSPAQVAILPEGMTVSATKLSGAYTSVEFNTRGVVVDPLGSDAEVVHLTLIDHQLRTRTVEVWPSGQVQAESLVGMLP